MIDRSVGRSVGRGRGRAVDYGLPSSSFAFASFASFARRRRANGRVRSIFAHRRSIAVVAQAHTTHRTAPRARVGDDRGADRSLWTLDAYAFVGGVGVGVGVARAFETRYVRDARVGKIKYDAVTSWARKRRARAIAGGGVDDDAIRAPSRGGRRISRDDGRGALSWRGDGVGRRARGVARCRARKFLGRCVARATAREARSRRRRWARKRARGECAARGWWEISRDGG